MESLENVLLGRRCDRISGVSNRQYDLSAVLMCGYAEATASSIVLSRVLEKVFHDQRGVSFFTGDIYVRWKVLLDLHIERIRKRVEIVQPFVHQLTEIHWLRIDLKMPGIHARKQKQIINNTGQSVRLV